MADPIERLKVALADRYTIERELGQGGMATVYLAKDIKHEREVAIKVISPEMAESMGKERFLREIRITAQLNHPHILALYDSGEADGVLYYVMPYVRGESLRQRLERDMQLPLEEAVLITREAADALSYAHMYGLIHRDIKPENIMLAGGHAIVADFGIARAVGAAGSEKLTQSGMAVGTPAYMSPEQAMGDPNVDARSDIYSLGCVLYEMIAGDIPFTGPTPQAIIARHSMDMVTPPHIMRQSVPEDLEDIILHAMEKTPADRYQTAQQMVEDLQAVASGQPRQGSNPRITRRTMAPQHVTIPPAAPARSWLLPAGVTAAVLALAFVGWRLMAGGGAGVGSGVAAGAYDPSRIAVLYFDDASPAGDLADVADGLTEGIIDNLSAISSLDVVSRSGVGPFRDPSIPRDRIARALEAGTLVMGSVSLEGRDRLHVSARLIDGESGADVGRAGFSLPRDDFEAVRDSITQEIARALRERLGEEVRLRPRREAGATVAAWTSLLRGEKRRKDAEDRLAAHDGAAALAAFLQADSVLATAETGAPDWARPSVMRGQIAYRLARLLAGEPEEAAEQIEVALGHAARALDRAPNDAPALELRGTVQYLKWLLDLVATEREAAALLQAAQADLEAAIDRDPSLASAHSTLSHLYYQTDNITSAVISAREAYRQDAYLNVANEVLWRLFLGSYDLAQFSQAGTSCDEGARRFPDDYRFTECRLLMMTTSPQAAEPARAWTLYEQLVALTPEARAAYESSRGAIIVGGVLARAGLKDSALAVLTRARPSAAVDPTQELSGVEAYMRTLAGDDDGAIDVLKRYAAGHHAFEVGGDLHWWWRDLRNHPRFRELQIGGR
ncbi:MAG TPA: serine/threonine-protein kinase [Gemmatimonadales bacterium]